jgi:hypothetical protein
MSAAGKQAQCRKVDNTGTPGTGLDTVASLPEGKTAPAMENIFLKNISSFGKLNISHTFQPHTLTCILYSILNENKSCVKNLYLLRPGNLCRQIGAACLAPETFFNEPISIYLRCHVYFNAYEKLC